MLAPWVSERNEDSQAERQTIERSSSRWCCRSWQRGRRRAFPQHAVDEPRWLPPIVFARTRKPVLRLSCSPTSMRRGNGWRLSRSSSFHRTRRKSTSRGQSKRSKALVPWTAVLGAVRCFTCCTPLLRTVRRWEAVHATAWVREETPVYTPLSRAQRVAIPIEDKESHRWVATLQQAVKKLAALPRDEVHLRGRQ